MKILTVHRLSLTIKLLLILVSLVLVGLIFVVFHFHYDEFISFISQQYGEPEKIDHLRKQYLTVHTFELLRYFLVLFAVVFIVGAFLFRRYIHTLSLFFHGTLTQLLDLFKSMFREIGALSVFHKVTIGLVFLVLVTSRIFYLFQYPLVNDELFSYMYLVDKGFLPSTVYYPGPNNHIFFSQAAVLFNTVLHDPVLAMRMPSLIIGIITVFFLFVLINRKLGFEVALLATTLFSFSFNIFYYSIHGRGYAMMYFFFILAFFAFLKITEEGGAKRIYKILFVAMSAMGFYTIPVFLYPFAAMSVFGIGYFLSAGRMKELWHFLVLNIFVAGIVLFVYLPIFFLNGMDAVTGNSWVTPLEFEDFIGQLGNYVLELGNYLWNVQYAGSLITLLVLIAGIAIMYIIGYSKIASLTLVLLLFPFIILFLQRVLPFFRVWDYQLVLLSLLLALALQYLVESTPLRKFNQAILIILVLVIIGINSVTVQLQVNRGFPYYSMLNQFVNKALSEKVERIYVEEDTYHLFLLYHARERKVKVELFTHASPHDFDLVVLPVGKKFPKYITPRHYKPYIFNRYIRSYKKK